MLAAIAPVVGTEVVEHLRSRRRGARDRARRRRRDARPAFRSNAWPCSTPPTSPTPACCTSTSSSPGSRTTARRRGRCRSRARARPAAASSRSPTPTSAATTCAVCSRPAPVLDGRGRRVPAREWERAVARGGRRARGRRMARPARRVRGGLAADERGDRRTRRRSTRSASFVARSGRRRSIPRRCAEDVARARPARAPARAALPRRRRAPRRRGRRSNRSRPGGSRRCSTGWAPSTRSIPARPSTVFRRTLELELDAARDRVGRLGEGVLVGPVGMALGVDLDRLWVCGLAEGVFPAVPHDDPLLADRERAVARRRAARCAPNAPPTTNAPCSPRSRRRPARGCAPIRAATSAAAPSTFRRGSSRRAAVGRRRARRSRRTRTRPSHVAFAANRHELGVRAAIGGEAWVAADRPWRAGLELAPGPRRRGLHPLRRQPRASRRAARGRSARDADRSPRRRGCRRGRRCPHAYFMQTCCTSSRSNGPRTSCSSRRSTAAASCTRCSTASSPRCAARPTPAGRGTTPTTPAARDRGRGERGRRGAGA